MFSLSSKLQGRVNAIIRKRWRLFHAMDFESLMRPSFTFCYILGVFPYKINASAFEISKPRYILSTVAICACFSSLLSILYTIDGGYMKFRGVPRTLERNCFYILSGVLAVITYILSGPRMRLLQTIMEISSNLPPESYQRLSKLIHAKDIIGFFFLVMELPLYIEMNVPVILKIFVVYVGLLMFQMDMMYMNCVCVLKACFKRLNDNLEHVRVLMINDEINHLDQMYYKQRSPLMLIKLKALKKQHLLISNAVQMLNITFSLQLLITITLTFIEITFELYFHILYWKRGISMIEVEDHVYEIFLMLSVMYYFTKITLIVWACETGKDQAQQIGTTVHGMLNSVGDNEIKSELHLFSLQIMHRENKFSTKSLTVDAKLLTAMAGNITTYLLILMQFLNMPNFCDKEIANITQTIQ
ncbi:PREDICTED: uncharacterized protein LOC105557304 [Vollenhovia emeryi]|uniref:uncharacterized protein LOC105557304 n=1 Tax=Vollenhovia emeryi TaxID=411798 RepID=UPI0005F490CA|nr:PREDICTED: uncharacterized protein LOC105557304 [Vollenhovia emeryi]